MQFCNTVLFHWNAHDADTIIQEMTCLHQRFQVYAAIVQCGHEDWAYSPA